jgi:hypothetical protein
MFVTRRRLNNTIAAYQSEVKHYSNELQNARLERDLYKRELEAIRDRIGNVLPSVSVATWTTT